MKLLVGADPEIWIFDNKLGKIISAHGLFPGTKEEPYQVEHGAVQVDGMAAEYNILPASTVNEFVFYNISVLRSLRDLIKERNPNLDFEFVFEPVSDFGAEYIAEQPEVARRLGCTPDFNAWKGGKENPTPDADMPFRTASGHIHLGWTKDQDIHDPEFIEACCMISKQMDCYVAPNTLYWEGSEGHRRRELYGKAGAFRPKSYGVEYRTSSNSWLESDYYMSRIFLQTQDSFVDLLGGYRAYEERYYQRVREAIDTRDEVHLERTLNWRYNNYGNTLTMDNLDSLYAEWGHKKKNEVGMVAPIHDEDPGPVDWDDDEEDFDIIEIEPWEEPAPF